MRAGSGRQRLQTGVNYIRSRFHGFADGAPSRLPTDKVLGPAVLAPRERDPRVARDRRQDMRMPPYMRDSDGTALSLTWRQYHAVIDFIARVEKAGPAERASLSPALRHVATVVARRKAAGAGAAKPKHKSNRKP